MGGCADARPPAMRDDSGIPSKTSPSPFFPSVPAPLRAPPLSFFDVPCASAAHDTCRTTHRCHAAWRVAGNLGSALPAREAPCPTGKGTSVLRGQAHPTVCISHIPHFFATEPVAPCRTGSQTCWILAITPPVPRVGSLLPQPLDNNINRLNSTTYLTRAVWRSTWHTFRYMSIERTPHASLKPLTTSGESP